MLFYKLKKEQALRKWCIEQALKVPTTCTIAYAEDIGHYILDGIKSFIAEPEKSPEQ